jgi:hypothetical protein
VTGITGQRISRPRSPRGSSITKTVPRPEYKQQVRHYLATVTEPLLLENAAMVASRSHVGPAHSPVGIRRGKRRSGGGGCGPDDGHLPCCTGWNAPRNQPEEALLGEGVDPGAFRGVEFRARAEAAGTMDNTVDFPIQSHWSARFTAVQQCFRQIGYPRRRGASGRRRGSVSALACLPARSGRRGRESVGESVKRSERCAPSVGIVLGGCFFFFADTLQVALPFRELALAVVVAARKTPVS